MFFLLRTAFWLTLVLVLIPIGSEEESTPVESVNPVSAYLAAQATVSDIGGFCDRNPVACETGGNALTAIGSRARDGARIVYEYLDTQVAEDTSRDTMITGSTNVQPTSDQSVQIEYPAFETVSAEVQNKTTEIGPTPRPKPRSGPKT
ncbi:DUF5330 domain-containing protein [Labrenzia sp. PHM005]|uniref:DUF5330 domain-containing protein n=1 Tax=Labrenzia sp. PHM005 TaxID=2590016 RepID=UPI0011408076|nr:DUF5330 domain-containing protein [Labrenzia sp. PHM005]QDG76987.1 hypothetical protein FJ695_14485 [Labrenzia sp. PHM005]